MFRLVFLSIQGKPCKAFTNLHVLLSLHTVLKLLKKKKYFAKPDLHI